MLKKRVWEVLEVAAAGDRLSRITDLSLTALIVLNVVAVILETVPSLGSGYAKQFQWFEAVSVAIFTAEYCLRVWSCTSAERFSRPFAGRLRFMFTPLALIDFAAVAPFYIPATMVDLRMLRLFRLLRFLRIAKLGRYSKSVRLMGQVLKAKKEQLALSVTLMFFLMLTAASLMYFAENAAQPEAFSSIPAAMWWAVTTLTTVGYGDMYPVTVLGRFFGSLIAIIGIGMFALPAGILSAGFVEAAQSEEDEKKG